MPSREWSERTGNAPAATPRILATGPATTIVEKEEEMALADGTSAVGGPAGAAGGAAAAGLRAKKEVSAEPEILMESSRWPGQ